MPAFKGEPFFRYYLLDISHKVNAMIAEDKQKIRNQLWGVLEDNNLIRTSKSCFGRIPNFKGASRASLKLKSTCAWRNSQTIFTSPDSSLREVRENALRARKFLIMATPKIKDGYLFLDPVKVRGYEKRASTIEGAFHFAEKIRNFPIIDLVVEGSLGVDLKGNRLGKGGGYADREISHLLSVGAINKNTTICTLVHPLQIVDKIPVEGHDENINMIVTPEMVIRTDYIKLERFL